MIPQAAIIQWRNIAPWPQDVQIEQDLLLSRALIEIFNDPFLSEELILRGGTALHKLYIKTPQRYSEDIDLVQARPGPIGAILDSIRVKLDPLLGIPARENKVHNVVLKYRVESEIPPIVQIRLKIEINSREHFSVYGSTRIPFEVQSIWYSGKTMVQTYSVDELLATKMRALYQRKKGRDLFDLWLGLNLDLVDPIRIVSAFTKYMKFENHTVTRQEFESNLMEKMSSGRFDADIRPLLNSSVRYDANNAAKAVLENLIGRIAS